MTAPFSLSDLLSDEEWVKEMQKTARGRQELKRMQAQAAKEEIDANLANKVEGYNPAERARLAEFQKKEREESKRLGIVAETGRDPVRKGNAFDAALGGVMSGAAQGIFTALPNTVEGLALGPINRLTGGAFRGASDAVEDIRAGAQEIFQRPASTASNVGEFVGGVAGSIPFMGPVARLGAKPVAAVLERVAPRAADAVRASAGIATKLGGGAPGRLAQGAANVAAGVPFSILQQIGMEDASLAERAKALATSTAADFGFGSIFAQRPGTALETAPRLADVPAPTEARTSIEAGFEAKRKATAEKEAAKNAEQEAKKTARALTREQDLIVETGALQLYRREKGKEAAPWQKLPKEEKDSWRKRWLEENPQETPQNQPEASPIPAFATQPTPVATEIPSHSIASWWDALSGPEQIAIAPSLTRATKYEDLNALARSHIEDYNARQTQVEEPTVDVLPDDDIAPEIFIPSNISTPRPKTRKSPMSKEKTPQSFGPLIPGLDEIPEGTVLTPPRPTEPIQGPKELTPFEGPEVVPRPVPPVVTPQSTVRLYHGGVPYADAPGPRWLTPDRAYAEAYAKKSDTGEVQYVDLPTDHPLVTQNKAFDDTGTSTVAPVASFEAPQEIAAQLQLEVKAPETAPVLDTNLDASVAAPETAPATSKLIQDPRAWWNSMPPGSAEKTAWLEHGGWSPNAQASKVNAPNARYDALPTKAREAAKVAHEAYLRGEAPWVPPKVKQAPAVVEKIPTKPEPVTLPDGRTFEYDWSKARRPRNIADTELADYVTETARRVEVTQNEKIKAEYAHVLEKLKDNLKDRKFEAGPGPELRAQSHGAVGGGLAGFMTGVWTTDEDDPYRDAKIAAWTVAGAFGGGMAQRWGDNQRFGRNVTRQLPTAPTKGMVSLEDGKAGSKPLSTRLRDFYTEGVRSIAPAEQVIRNLADYSPDRARNALRNMALFGNWVSQTEEALTSRLVYRDTRVDSPTYGEPVYIKKDDGSDILTPKHILAVAQGDVESLGELAIAMRVIERDAMGVQKHPMDIAEANKVYHSAPAHMLQAVKELREFHYGIAKMLHLQGRITDAGLAAMKEQEWYTPFYYRTEKGQVRSLDAFNERHIGTPDPLKAAKSGSKLAVINPFEQTLVLTPRFLRAIEWGQVTQSVVDFSRSIGDEDVRKALVRRKKPSGKEAPIIKKIEEDAKAIAQQLGVKPEDVAGLVTTLHADDPNWTTGVITNWERGTLVTYEVNKAVFDGLKSLLPIERDLLTSLFARSANLLSRGVVNSPVFVFNQFFKDTFEATTMSQYGFRPIVDSARALKHIYGRSNEYLRLLDMGGPGTVQSIKYLDPKKALTSIQAEGGTAMAIAWQQMKEMHPIEAYKTMILPFAEAARVGEYLRALDHGETSIEAVYAAWNVLGNTRIQGASTAMRKLTTMTPFLRASIAAIDELGARSGTHAFRGPEGPGGAERGRGEAFLTWAVKGVTSLVLPTLAFRALEHVMGDDDQMMQDVRHTQVGQRYWFMKPGTILGEQAAEKLGFSPGDIIRIPRPHSSGIMFAAAADKAWDKMAHDHPFETMEWAKALVSSLYINTIPTVGVVLAGMLSGEDISRGPGETRPIVPYRDQRLDPSEQGRLTASMPARIVGGQLGKLPMIGKTFSPPMIDWMLRSVGGAAADDLLRSITLIESYVDEGFVPAKHELPVVKAFLTSYPNTNTAPVEKFYRYADKAEGVYLAAQARSRNDPEGAARYIQENVDVIKYADLLRSARRDISELRAAAVDIKRMTPNYATPEQRRRVEREMHSRIITLARTVVGVVEREP